MGEKHGLPWNKSGPCPRNAACTVKCGNNNTLPFYLPWKQVQDWVLEDYHNDIIVNHASIDNGMCDNDPHKYSKIYIYEIVTDHYCKRYNNHTHFIHAYYYCHIN